MWKDRYEIGVELIDRQHEELFKRLSDFIEVVLFDEPYEEKLEEVGRTFHFLDDYFKEHFAAEEDYQRKIGYPGYDEHKWEHERFIEEIDGYRKKFDEGKLVERDLKALSARFLTWLIMHVGYEDQKIGEYAESKGLI